VIAVGRAPDIMKSSGPPWPLNGVAIPLAIVPLSQRYLQGCQAVGTLDQVIVRILVVVLLVVRY
jgi:hypothetical protein